MNWIQTRIAFWLILIFLIFVTLYLNLIRLLQEPFLNFFVIVEGALASGMMLNEIMKKRERVELEMSSIHKGNKVGFTIRSKNKTLKGAQVRFNGKNYDWETETGNSLHTMDIFVGDEPPATFFPLKVKAEWLDKAHLDDVPQGIVILTVSDSQSLRKKSIDKKDFSEKVETIGVFEYSEIQTDKIVWQFAIAMPEKSVSPIGKDGLGVPLGDFGKLLGELKVSIRLIAEGIEEERDYSMGMRIVGVHYGEPDSHRLEYVTELKKLKK